MHLPPTEVLDHDQLALGHIRDEIAATRPDGCNCLGAGTQHQGKNLTHADWCSCPEGVAARKLWQEERDAAAEKKRLSEVNNRWSSYDSDGAGVPMRFLSFDLQGHPNKAAAERLLKSLNEDNENGWEHVWSDSWFLYGDYGKGKTGLALGYAKEVTFDPAGPDNFLFRRVPDLLTELRGTYNQQDSDDGKHRATEQEVLERYQDISLLVLDDLGAEQINGSGWVEDRLYQIIGHRHDEMMATIFTSNLDIPQLANKIGERLTWRIVEMCGEDHIIEVKGKNLRDFKAK